MKKIPTKEELRNLNSLTIKDLKEFAKECDFTNLPSRISKKSEIIDIIIKRTKHPTNIEIDKNIDIKCPLPNSYNKKVWKYVMKEAKHDKQWALDNISNFNDRLDARNDMIIKGLEKTVCEIAKERYDYFKMRSHAVSENTGNDIDPSAKHQWIEITTGKKYKSKGLLDF